MSGWPWLGLAMWGCVSVASAQQYPVKPIRIVNGFAPGGPTDIYARLIGQKLTAAWGQQVIVDPRPGASGNIAADHVAKSAPDGYTLFLPSFSLAVNPSIFPKLPYDVLKACRWRRPMPSPVRCQ